MTVVLCNVIFPCAVNDVVQQFVVLQQLMGGVEHGILNVCLPHGLLVAGAEALLVGADVIIMLDTGFTGAALSEHQSTALAAEQLVRENVVGTRPCFRRCSLVDLQHFLHFVKHVVLDNPGHAVLDLAALVFVNANVLLVLQNRMQAVLGEGSAAQRPQAHFIQLVNDFRNCLAVRVHGEDHLHCGRGIFVYDELFVRSGLVPQRAVSAQRLALLGALSTATADVLRKL